MVDNFLNKDDPRNYEVSKKGLQSLAKLKSMWPSVEKFYLAFLKETILRHAKEVTDKLIGSEAEAIQNINKLEQLIKDLESKKNTMAVDLKFGETFTAHYKCQNLIEVEVKTDKGAWTFNFDRWISNMENTPKDRATILIEELKILQGIINRMTQNSLECKKWTLALVVGVLSLKIEAISNSYGLCVLGVLLLCFWFLDAYYLMQEKLFREQYQWLIENRLKTDERLFEVFPAHQTCQLTQFLSAMRSRSLFPYWVLGLCLVVYGFVFDSVLWSVSYKRAWF